MSSRRSSSASVLCHGGTTEIGDSRVNPTMASSISAASSASRASGPCTLSGFPRQTPSDVFGTSPGVGRMPTMPQNAAGMRMEQPKSVP